MDRNCRLLALGLSCLVALPLVAADTALWYASDAAAFQGEAVSGLAASEYVLEVTQSAGVETSILYRKGKEESRKVTSRLPSGRRELVLVAGVAREERTYDQAGNILEERFFAAPASAADGSKASAGPSPSEIRRYSYASGRLRKVESLDASGAVQGRMEYRYDPSGRLVELSTSGIFGSSQVGLAPGPGLPSAMWFSVPTGSDKELVDITRYDPSGRPLERSTWKEGLRLGQVLFGYDEAGRLLSRKDIDLSSQRTAETGYDQEGRAILIVKSLEGREESRESFTYDASGRLLSDEFRGQGGLRKTTYSYEAPGELSRAVTTVNGVVESIVTVLVDGMTRRELFDKGQLFLRALYADGRLRKEEFIEGGKVLRSKDYP